MASAHPRNGHASFVPRLLDVLRHVAWMVCDPRFMARTALRRDFVKAVLADEHVVRLALAERNRTDKFADDPRFAAFRAEFDEFAARARECGNRLPVHWEDRYACLDDRTSTTPFDRHYIYHPAWAARVLPRTRPEKHIDISSTIAFCLILSAFVPVEFYDFRPAGIMLNGLTCGAADLMKLPFPDGSVKSLSCMHVLEHIGLSRYGDPIDPGDRLRPAEQLPLR